MSGGHTWVYVLMVVGALVSLYIVLKDKSEIRKEKATVIACASFLPFIVMMCSIRGGISLLDFFFITYLLIKLKRALMEIWEYYDPSPW